MRSRRPAFRARSRRRPRARSSARGSTRSACCRSSARSQAAHACVAFEDSDFGAQSAAGAGASVVTVPDLKAPTPEIVALSLHVLASLDDAVALVPSWFGELDKQRPA